jgi:hypothetical protein
MLLMWTVCLPVLCCAVPQGALVFGEQLTLFTLAGGVLIFAGVLLVAVRTRTPDNSSTAKEAAGASNSTGSMQSAEGADAAVPLKAFDYHHQQQQQQQQRQQQQQAAGPDTTTRSVDQAQTPAKPAAAGAAAIPADVELGVRHQRQQPGSSSSSSSSSYADSHGAGDTQQEQQQPLLLRPLLSERPSGSSSFSGSFSSAGSLLQGTCSIEANVG